MEAKLAIDDRLINETVQLGGHPSKKAAVTAALQEYIQYHKQKQILSFFGQIEYDPDYDYKKERRNEDKFKY